MSSSGGMHASGPMMLGNGSLGASGFSGGSEMAAMEAPATPAR